MLDPVREAIKEAFPEQTQLFWTWLTGKPYKGQQEFRVSKWFFLVKSLLCLPIGVLFVFFGMQSLSLVWLIPLGWIITVHGKAVLKSTVMHHCAHGTFFRSKQHNDLLGDFLSIISHADAYEDYKAEHPPVHHSYKLLTKGEPTYQSWFVLFGMQLGESREDLRKKFYGVVFSPLHYMRTFLKRMRQAFGSSYPMHNVKALFIWGTILTVVFLTNSWLLYIVGWWVPSFIIHEACLLFLIAAEHVWVDPNIEETDLRKLHQHMTVAVFNGDPLPSHRGLRSWVVTSHLFAPSIAFACNVRGSCSTRLAP